jgi:transketolase
MRREFADILLEEMMFNKDIYLLCGDLGYKVFDAHIVSFPDRAINCGASEQMMLDVAVGLAQSGKIPFVYSITPFLLYRGFETLRTYINHESINVKLIGSGRDQDYEIDGFSHDASDVKTILSTLPNIVQFFPEKKEELKDIIKEMITNNKPSFLSLRR